ncbi:MAG: hypothetical protein H6R17_2165 [Proteobacteria bacterium]|nr:hypothetical protein [Pseudomonadota bacterium]
MTDFPGLVFSANENQLLASLRQSSERPLLDLDGLREMLSRAGYGQCQLFDEALSTLVEAYNSPGIELELTIGECRAASFTLEIAADAMQAWINVTAARGGKALEVDAVFAALDAAGVIFGIDQAAVSAVCAASATQGAERACIASGKPAENGIDASFELLVTDARDRSPRVDEKGLIDFRDLGEIPSVAAEQPLMRRIPPTTGTAGRNVRGGAVEPVPGKNLPFAENLVGAYVADDDANLLRAVFSGQPVRCGNGVNVEPILHFRNVNLATGNVSFDGTVSIEGEVLPGMKVHATGDIIVGGVIDGAELKAGGDIRIGGGIIAKAQVEAGGAVSARFVENSQVLAGTTIAIDDTALQSDLQANNQIVVGLNSPRGRLAGGSARAMMLIQVPILGSSTGGVTRLLLGVNPVLDAKYQQLQKTIEKQREEESNLEKLVKHLSTHGDKAGMLERAKASWQKSLQAWAKLLPERDALEQELALTATAKIEVGAGVEGAVDITFCGKALRLRRTYETGSFSMDGDHIVFTDMMGHVKPAG